MRRKSNPSPGPLSERRIGPTRTGVGSARVSLCQPETVWLVAATLIILVWLADLGSVKEGMPVRLVPGKPGGHTSSFVLSANGTKMAVTDLDGSVALRDVRSGWKIESLLRNPGYTRSASFFPDGRFLACAGSKTGITLHDLEPGGEVRTLPVPLEDIRFVAIAPDCQTLVVTTKRDGRILFWNLAESRVSRMLHSPSPVVSLAFSPDGRYLVSGQRDADFSMSLWDIHTGRCRHRLTGTGGGVRALAFSNSGDRLASAGSWEHGVRLWDLGSGKLERVIEGHAFGTTGLSFSPDGTTLATAGNDGAVRLWKVSTGRQEAVLDGDATTLVGVVFSPDGQWVAAASMDDDHLRMWDLSGARADQSTTVGHRSR